MIYSVLTVGLSDKLVAALQSPIIQYDLNFTTSLTTREQTAYWSVKYSIC